MGYYQKGDPGIFDVIGRSVAGMFGAGARSTGQRYLAEPGQFVSKMGGIVSTFGSLVGTVVPGIGQAIAGAGNYIQGAGDSMSTNGYGMPDPSPYAGPLHIQPWNALPQFNAPPRSVGGTHGFAAELDIDDYLDEQEDAEGFEQESPSLPGRGPMPAAIQQAFSGQGPSIAPAQTMATRVVELAPEVRRALKF